MSGTLKIGNKEIFTHSDATNKVTAGSGFPYGHVIQTEYAETSDIFDITNTTPPGEVVLSKAIIPINDNSKILVMIQLTYSKQDQNTGYARLYRDSTWVYPYTSDRGFSLRNQSAWGVDIGYIQYLDSPPTTGSVTYNLYAYTTHATNPMAINRNYNTSQDTHSGGRASSSMILMEIAP